MINQQDCCPMATCAMSSSCAHFKQYQQAEAAVKSFTIMNPKFLHPTRKGCAHYVTLRRERWAYGFTRMLDSIPKGQAQELRFLVRCDSDSAYYRMRRGDRPIYPDMQEAILQYVRLLGGDESLDFDRYEEHDVYVKP